MFCGSIVPRFWNKWKSCRKYSIRKWIMIGKILSSLCLNISIFIGFYGFYRCAELGRLYEYLAHGNLTESHTIAHKTSAIVETLSNDILNIPNNEMRFKQCFQIDWFFFIEYCALVEEEKCHHRHFKWCQTLPECLHQVMLHCNCNRKFRVQLCRCIVCVHKKKLVFRYRMCRTPILYCLIAMRYDAIVNEQRSQQLLPSSLLLHFNLLWTFGNLWWENHCFSVLYVHNIFNWILTICAVDRVR